MVFSTDKEARVPITTERVRDVANACLGAALAVRLQTAMGADELLGQTVSSGVLELGFQRIRSALRWQDQIQKVSSSEVSVLLHESAPLETVEQLARRLVELIQRAYVVQGQVLFLQAFIGVAVSDAADNSIEALCTQATTALKIATLGEAGTGYLL